MYSRGHGGFDLSTQLICVCVYVYILYVYKFIFKFIYYFENVYIMSLFANKYFNPNIFNLKII